MCFQLTFYSEYYLSRIWGTRWSSNRIIGGNVQGEVYIFLLHFAAYRWGNLKLKYHHINGSQHCRRLLYLILTCWTRPGLQVTLMDEVINIFMEYNWYFQEIAASMDKMPGPGLEYWLGGFTDVRPTTGGFTRQQITFSMCIHYSLYWGAVRGSPNIEALLGESHYWGAVRGSPIIDVLLVGVPLLTRC